MFSSCLTTEGIIIQLRCEEISTYGRITSGVKLMNTKEGEAVKKIAKVRQTEKTQNEETQEEETQGEEAQSEESSNEEA